MSWEASVWALKYAPVGDCQRKMVLMGLADHASDTGLHAFPTRRTLAEYACCSVRTVARHLAELESAGLIRRGDQEFVSHYPAHLRPTVWDLVMSIRKPAPAPEDTMTPVSPMTPGDTPDTGYPVSPATPGDTGDTPPVTLVTPPQGHQCHPPGDTGDTGPVTLVSHITPLVTTRETTREPPRETARRGRDPAPLALIDPVPAPRRYTPVFEEFWRVYPLPAEQPRAFVAWKRAIRRHDPTAIIAAARSYADCPDRENTFTKKPANWLDGDCWNDPLPQPRTTTRTMLIGPNKADRRAQEAIEAGRRLTAMRNATTPHSPTRHQLGATQ